MGIFFTMVLLPCRFFQGKIYKSQEKEIIKIIYERKNISDICEYYSYSYSQVLGFMNYSYFYSYRSWLRESIPIPIRGKNNYLLMTELMLYKQTRAMPGAALQTLLSLIN